MIVPAHRVSLSGPTDSVGTSNPLSKAEGLELIKLCRQGRLYEVEAWINAGRSITVPKELWVTPLYVALSTGFHSLAVLLLRTETDQEGKNEALETAFLLNNREFMEMAIVRGADVRSIPFVDVLRTGDRTLAKAFLDRGADPIIGAPFAHAFSELRAKSTLGSYLDCRRDRPELAEPLQRQADIALAEACSEGKLRWVCLMLWVGANPRARVPSLGEIDEPEDQEYERTAIQRACEAGRFDLLKALKLNATDDLDGLLTLAGRSASRDVLAYLLDLGARPNDKPDGSSSALHGCMTHLRYEAVDRTWCDYGRDTLEGRDAMRLLLERGAVWKPEPSELKDLRRVLYRLEPQDVMELLYALLKNPEGLQTVRDLLRVSRLRKHMAACVPQLAKLGLAREGRRRSKDPPSSTPSQYVRSKYRRERLYEELWSEPTLRVARKYGVSDVALTKVCRRLAIPKPPRGYWARKRAGRAVPPRPRLEPL